jgi:hypothetical protein
MSMPHQGRRAVAALCLLSLLWLPTVAAGLTPAGGGGRVAEPATWSQAAAALWSQVVRLLGVSQAPAPGHAQPAGSGSGSGSGCDGSSGMDPNGPNQCK